MLDVHARFGPLTSGGDVHGRVTVQPGGTSANAAVWATWAGARSAVVAAVGQDLVGELLIRSLDERGVDVTGVVRHEAPSGAMLVAVETGTRSMVADRGANAALVPGDLGELRAGAVLISGYLLLQQPGYETALAALAGCEAELVAVEAASWPLIDAFGAGRFFQDTSAASVILANDDEARSLVGRSGFDAARELGERYRIAAVKSGPAGAALVVEGALHQAGAEAVDEMDATGAGDAFDGVLLAGLARGDEPAEALAAACRAGGLVAASPHTWPDGPRS
jgi:sugar/nucleoside kinase (ribokinase family)